MPDRVTGKEATIDTTEEQGSKKSVSLEEGVEAQLKIDTQFVKMQGEPVTQGGGATLADVDKTPADETSADDEGEPGDDEGGLTDVDETSADDEGELTDVDKPSSNTPSTKKEESDAEKTPGDEDTKSAIKHSKFHPSQYNAAKKILDNFKDPISEERKKADTDESGEITRNEYLEAVKPLSLPAEDKDGDAEDDASAPVVEAEEDASVPVVEAEEDASKTFGTEEYASVPVGDSQGGGAIQPKVIYNLFGTPHTIENNGEIEVINKYTHKIKQLKPMLFFKTSKKKIQVGFIMIDLLKCEIDAGSKNFLLLKPLTLTIDNIDSPIQKCNKKCTINSTKLLKKYLRDICDKDKFKCIFDDEHKNLLIMYILDNKLNLKLELVILNKQSGSLTTFDEYMSNTSSCSLQSNDNAISKWFGK